MVNRVQLAGFAALAALAAAAISCGSIDAPAGVSREMAASIPTDTVLLTFQREYTKFQNYAEDSDSGR